MLEFNKTGNFKKNERITQSGDIKNLFVNGKKFNTAGAKLFVTPNNGEVNRIVFTLKRGFGNAVQRNYAKRLSREAYRRIKSELCTGYDLLLLMYPNYDLYSLRYKQIVLLCQKAHLIK